jgi:hypothetical protein
MAESSHLAEVNFIKHDLVRVCNGIEAGCESEDSDDSKSELVVPIIRSGLLGLALQLRNVVAGLVDGIVDLLFGAGRWPLPGAHRRRHGKERLVEWKSRKCLWIRNKASPTHKADEQSCRGMKEKLSMILWTAVATTLEPATTQLFLP